MTPYLEKRVSTNKRKQSWKLVGKSLDTLNDHAHMGIKTPIKNDQSESECVPWQRAIMRYKKMGLMHN